jgi:hypothetical protein
MCLGIYDRATKEIEIDPFEDNCVDLFEIGEDHIVYSVEKGIVKREKKRWEVVERVDTGTVQANDVFVDKDALYFNDNDGSFYVVAF